MSTAMRSWVLGVKSVSPIFSSMKEGHQSAPMIVLGKGREPKDVSVAVQEYNGTRFINAPDDIRRYLSSQYSVVQAS